MMVRCLVFVQVLLFFCISYAKKPEKGFYFSQNAGISYNPMGMILESNAFFRAPLIKKNGILWENTKFEAGLLNEWTPADNLIGAMLKIEPIGFFDLALKAGYYSVYNCLGYGLYSLDSAGASYDKDALEGLSTKSAAGYRLSVTPQLKARIKSLILLNSFAVTRIDLGRDEYYVEIRTWSIHKTTDTDFINDLNVLYEFNPKFIAGANYRYLHATGTSFNSHRLSALGVWVPHPAWAYDAFVLLTAGAYLHDRLFGTKPFFGFLAGVTFKIG